MTALTQLTYSHSHYESLHQSDPLQNFTCIHTPVQKDPH